MFNKVLIAALSLLLLFTYTNAYYIYTNAGNGTGGSTGDNGPAASAEVSTPYGVAVSVTGEVYIADTTNNRIRVVSTNVG